MHTIEYDDHIDFLEKKGDTLHLIAQYDKIIEACYFENSVLVTQDFLEYILLYLKKTNDNRF